MDPVPDDNDSGAHETPNPFESVDPSLSELPIIREFHRIEGPHPSDKLIAQMLSVLNNMIGP